MRRVVITNEIACVRIAYPIIFMGLFRRPIASKQARRGRVLSVIEQVVWRFRFAVCAGQQSECLLRPVQNITSDFKQKAKMEGKDNFIQCYVLIRKLVSKRLH